jgi:hypothetical protein
MSQQEHWSKRLHDILVAQEKPSYELLEEAVQELLLERQGLTATLTDMAKQIGRIVIARKADSTDGVLSLVDTLIAEHVRESKPASMLTH